MATYYLGCNIWESCLLLFCWWWLLWLVRALADCNWGWQGSEILFVAWREDTCFKTAAVSLGSVWGVIFDLYPTELHSEIRFGATEWVTYSPSHALTSPCFVEASSFLVLVWNKIPSFVSPLLTDHPSFQAQLHKVQDIFIQTRTGKSYNFNYIGELPFFTPSTFSFSFPSFPS